MKKIIYLICLLTILSVINSTHAASDLDDALASIDDMINETDDKALYKKAITYYNKKTKIDDKEAYKLFKQAANLGNYYAAEKMYFMGLAKRAVQSKSKLGWKKEMAKLGSPSAEHDLAGNYQRGQGVTKDLKKAARLFLSSAKKGHPHAKHDISTMYHFGNGVKKDQKKAIAWGKKAAKYNYSQTHFNLGNWLSKIDKKQSKKWYLSAEKLFKIEADKGNNYSAHMRALLYNAGWGVKKDRPYAFTLYQELAEKGYARSQDSLARMYWFGEGVKQDRLEARRWFKMAADNGYEPAKKALNIK